ncbi:UbiA prenyltransferase family-domain-containing protein [Xylariaceae sp. FL1272]|nr:UbiA prenyltransferase family-domain-containing protein [Xylariaceae sp. FL1272]
MLRFAYHVRTIWLFTFSDLKTIVIPNTVFGIANAICVHKYGMLSPDSTNTPDLIRRLPLVTLWIWINLLPFNINNQRTCFAVAEDAVNKPWRPLPSGRISSNSARVVMAIAYLSAQVFSVGSGGLVQSLSLVLLGTWYNNFNGADCHPLIRNGINALGYLCFASGAMEVALGVPHFLQTITAPRLVQWFGLVACVIFTTVHAQDMYDQEGDAVRGRQTLPLVLGDGRSRSLLAISTLVWSWVCPGFWNVGWEFRTASLLLALMICIRTLSFRDVGSDKKTFVIWNIWISVTFMLPLAGS